MLSEQLKDLEQTLWQTADTLRANSDLKSSEYSTPVLGLIFLKFADNKYSYFEKEIQDEYFKLIRKMEFRDLPKRLLKNFADIPKDATGDMFGQIYEYFLAKFAMAEGQCGGEFFTPRCVVRLPRLRLLIT